ncbi:MAG TPA: chromosome segregation protein SMC [Cyanobacteria bacterium UBA8803]|nr:chromosome segregation protein SMC [Cyanobacteria bacterium UBA9273]HBL57951.1 chromosome segregation protein SMC [Cyanobacteria bacterium UBA8803]
MRIKHLRVDNFKSLVKFDLPLANFNTLVGINGSGKSTVLQFFDFLSQQVKGDLDDWLKRRQWKASDINSKLTRKNNIDFEVLLSDDQNFEVKWSASFNRNTLRCTSERVDWNKNLIMKVENGKYSIWNLDEQEQESKLITIAFDYQGSLLSQIKESQLTPEILELKKFFEGLYTLDLLAPELLRQRTRDAQNSLGLGGERLSAFLYEMGEIKRENIRQKLSDIYPNLKQINVATMRSGWKELTVQEQFGNTLLKTEARHVADGFLRMLAVFAQLSKEQSFLLLDEIENGINPELIEFLVDSLVKASPQVLVTTHSPMILNYLEDDIAIAGVIYLYKKDNGSTQAVRLFDIPSMREKLRVMGPGEVYEDTLLNQLYEEINMIKK